MNETKDSIAQPAKPIIFADASSLKDSSCLRRLIYNNFYGFRQGTQASNYKAGYGSAFHKAMEYWYSTSVKNKEVEGVSIQKATDYYKAYTPYISQNEYEFRTPTHLVKCLEFYFKIYNQDAETLRPIKGIITPGLLETRFTYPAVLLSDDFYSEHFELIIAGTVDMIASYNGQEVFVDHKTTGTKWGYKDSFFKDFDLSVQMMLYTLMLKKLTGNLFPFIINGVFIKKPTQAAEKKGEWDGVGFERYGPKSYSVGQLEQFENTWLIPRIRDFKLWLEASYLSLEFKTCDPSKITEPNFSSCQTKFPCPYIGACSQDPKDQGRVLGMMHREEYNPLKFGE
jgi:hypothetical protein